MPGDSRFAGSLQPIGDLRRNANVAKPILILFQKVPAPPRSPLLPDMLSQKMRGWLSSGGAIQDNTNALARLSHRRSSMGYDEPEILSYAITPFCPTRADGLQQYVNSIGGTQLYTSENFARNGIALSFLESRASAYAQFREEHVPSLSIVDVLMFNNRDAIRKLLTEFSLASLP
jgi:hypothetical protein